MIYLDNSATTFIKPVNVKKAVMDAVGRYSVNPGRGSYPLSVELSEKIYKTRENINDFFGGYKSENTVFCSSCTMIFNILCFI